LRSPGGQLLLSISVSPALSAKVSTKSKQGENLDLLVQALIAILVLVLWETLGLRDWCLTYITHRTRTRTWKRFLKMNNQVVITMSLVPNPENKEAPRQSDVTVELAIRSRVGRLAQIVRDDDVDMVRVRPNLIVLGSTRHSRRAQELQALYDLPFQFVFDYVQGDPPRSVLKLASQYGQEYVSSTDSSGHGVDGFDYGTAFVATCGDKRVCWLGGIHGYGTMGVAKAILERPEQFFRRQPSGVDGFQWLFRIRYDPTHGDTFDAISNVELIGGAEPCTRRRQDRAVKAIISDFGNVLMTFDRDRTYRALAHVTSRPFREIAQLLEASGHQSDYECGKLDDRAFFETVMGALGAGNALSFDAFTELWGDIFWENRSVVDLFRQLKSQVSLVLLSNTNHLHFESVREHYPDVLNLFRAHVLSYREGMKKPAAPLFLTALAKAGSDLRPDQCFYVDDIPEYVEAARKLGMNGCVYHSFPSLVRSLREAGVNIR
jgi:FMN phosphatase YigB (HAD superfamily)